MSLKLTGIQCVYPSCYLFVKEKYKILQLHPNVHLFFNVKYKILQLYPNEIHNLENCTQTIICFSQQNKKLMIVPILPFILWLQNTKFLKLLWKGHLLFDKKSKAASKLQFVFWPQKTKFEVIPKRPFAFLLQTTKIEFLC